MKKLSLIIFSLLFLASCSSKFSLQKRRYTKGFYFAASNSKSKNQTSLPTKTEVKQANEIASVKIISSINQEKVQNTNTTILLQPNASVNFSSNAKITNSKSIAIEVKKIIKPLQLKKVFSISTKKTQVNRVGFFAGFFSYFFGYIAGFFYGAALVAFFDFLSTGLFITLLGTIVLLFCGSFFATIAVRIYNG